MSHRDPRDDLPDIRDGLTHRERIVLQCLYDLQQERGGRHVPTGMLYGTVGEHVDMSVEEMQSIMVRISLMTAGTTQESLERYVCQDAFY